MIDGPARFERTLTMPRRRAWFEGISAAGQALSATFYGASGVLLGGGALRVLGFVLAGSGLAAFAVGSFLALRKRNGVFRSRPVLVVASSAGLEIDGRLAFDRREIRSAHMTLRDGRHLARVYGRAGRAIELELEDRAQGAELLAALGVSEASHAVELPARTTVGGVAARALATVGAGLAAAGLGVWVLVAALVHSSPVVPQYLWGLLAIAGWIAATLPGGLRVGRDGVASRRVVGGARFVSFGDVASVACTKAKIVATTHEGKTIDLEATLGVAVPAREREGVTSRIDAALRGYRERRGEVAAVAPLVARGGEAPGEWLARLARLARGDGRAYRTGPLPAEHLLRVVEDVAAPATARAGAAVVLARLRDREAMTRVRVAAQGSASPRLRVALERVAAAGDAPGDADAEGALEAAIAEVEMEAPGGERQRAGR